MNLTPIRPRSHRAQPQSTTDFVAPVARNVQKLRHSLSSVRVPRPEAHNDAVARYPDYASLPEHIREMLRLVTDDDDAAERYALVPNKNLKGQSVMTIVNAPFGQRLVERFLLDLGNYLGVDDEMERFEPFFGRKR